MSCAIAAAALTLLTGCDGRQLVNHMGTSMEPVPYSPSLEYQRKAVRALNNYELTRQLKMRGIELQ